MTGLHRAFDAQALRLRVGRLHQLVGWPGWLGAVLLVAAAGTSLSTPTVAIPEAGPVQVRVAAPTPEPPREAAPDLATRAEVSFLLNRIQSLAVGAGRQWPAAEYRVVAATERELSALEVRCTLRAAYPQLREVISQWLQAVPGLTLRELSISRPNSDTAEVEAKMTLAVLLRDVPAASPGKEVP